MLAALDHRFADGLKRRAVYAVNDLLSNRRIGNRIKTDASARRRVLYLADLGQAAMQRCPGLDALNPPPPIAPEPQRDPRLLQGMLGSIQIDASERFRYWDATGEFRRFHARPNLSRPRLVEQEFQLDLAHVTNLYQFYNRA